MAKEKAKGSELTAYCMKTKKKGVVIQDAVIDVANGRFIAKGVDEDGNKLTTILSKANAEGHVAANRAVKGKGWSKK